MPAYIFTSNVSISISQKHRDKMWKMYGFMLVKVYCSLFILSVGGKVLSSLLTSSKYEKMQCSVRGSSHWMSEKGSSLRGMSVTGTGYPGKWSWHWALSGFEENLDNAFGHVVAQWGAGSGAQWSLQIPSNLRYSVIPWNNQEESYGLKYFLSHL